MPIEFDSRKDALNLAKHGVSLEVAGLFDWETAVRWVDDRQAYGEVRETALGYVGSRLHVLVFTRRAGRLRVISLRKANQREARRYEEGDLR